MTLTPLVSIVMPVYNGSKFLRESIDSILSQTLTDFEFLIINDGSVDDSELIILSYHDPRIKYVKNECNLGIVESLNKGVELSKGKYIARMDADDISLPTRIEKQCLYLSQNPTIVACGSLAQSIDKDGKVIGKMIYPIGTEHIKATHLFNSSFIHPTMLFKSAILKTHRYESNYEYAEDYFLFSQLLATQTLVNLNEILLYYRVHQDNITANKSAKMAESRKKVHFFQLKNLLNADPQTDLVDILETISINTYTDYTIKQYDAFFHELLIANQLNSVYNQQVFEKVLIEKWFQVLLRKAKSKIFTHYFMSLTFRWSHFTARHLRKMVKVSLGLYSR